MENLLWYILFLHNLKDSKLQHRSTKGCGGGSEGEESDERTIHLGSWEMGSADVILDPARRKTSKAINRQSWTSLRRREARLIMEGSIFQATKGENWQQKHVGWMQPASGWFSKGSAFSMESLCLTALIKNFFFQSSHLILGAGGKIPNPNHPSGSIYWVNCKESSMVVSKTVAPKNYYKMVSNEDSASVLWRQAACEASASLFPLPHTCTS